MNVLWWSQNYILITIYRFDFLKPVKFSCSDNLSCVQMQICDHANGHGWCPNIVNELAHLSPRNCGDNFKSILFKLFIQNSRLGAHSKSARWMPQNLISEKPTPVQVMAWCHQATSHYLDQCCPRSLMPYRIISPWWVHLEKSSIMEHQLYHFCRSLQILLS